MSWRPSDCIGVALFNFDSQNDHQLSLRAGDLVYILEEHSAGWYRGYLYYQPSKMGIFPANFVHIKESVSLKVGSKLSIVPAGDEVAMEASVAVKEWRSKLIEFYVRGTGDKFRKLLHSMEEVLSWRRNIIHSTATHDVLQSMRTKLTSKIDTVNHQLGCPLTPRDSQGSLVNCHKASAQELYKIHQERKAELDQNVTQTGSLQRKATLTPSSHFPHLFVQVNHVDHTFPEPCEIFMYLYDKGRKGQLSERFFMNSSEPGKKSSRHGRDTERPCALFTDLGTKDVQSTSMYLVCQIIRKGKMLLDDKKNISQSPFRRPYACGILEVTSVLQFQEENDMTSFQNEDLTTYNLPLYLCSANHESDFSTFHEKVAIKTGGKGGQKPGCSILLSLRLFRGELSQLQRDFSLTLTKSMQIVHKLGFPDIILPGDVRNDIYVTLECGQYEKGHKRAERNVEVAIEVVDGGGKIIPRSIILGAGATPIAEFESFIFYHNNYPRWNETFKLSIPFEKLPDTHLRITFRHVAKNESKDKAEKTFAFTYLKIMKNDGSIIEDGLHELYVYKAEGHKRWYDPKVYLSQASCKEDITRRGSKSLGAGQKLSVSDTVGGSTMVARSFREYVQISTLACSTKLTQKIELLMLLKWRQRQRDLGVVLTNLTCIDGEEVVKFLQDILDCLFDILNTNQDVYGEKVFDVLVFIFGLLLGERYQHFTTVLDIYISKHFSALLSHKFLVWVFDKSLREYAPVVDQHLKLVRVIQAMKYVFRFMVQSHVLFARQNKRDDATFKAELRQVFSTFSTLMGYQENKIKNIYHVQSALLMNIPQILPEVVQVLPENEVASLISHFLKSVRNTHATIPRDKIDFILTVLESPVKLMHSSEARQSLIPTFVNQLIEHMDHIMPRTSFKADDPSNHSCLVCVGALLEKLTEEGLGAEPKDFDHLVPLLFPVLRLCKQIPKANTLHRMNSVNLIGLLDVMLDANYSVFFGAQKSMYGNDLKDTLMDLMGTLKAIINGKLFPETWISMYLMQNRVIARALHNISTALVENFLRAFNFNPLIWDHYFGLCTEFLVQPCLQLEQFPDYREKQYQKQFGEMRLSVGRHVISMWHKLSEQKGNFIPDLIGPFLEVTLIKQHELRIATLPVVFDVMRCEQLASGNFKRVETEVFDKMDDLLFKGRGDEEYKEMFNDILKVECSKSKDFSQSGTAFIDSVSRLIAMLLDYRNVASDESYQGRRMGCMLNLLNFYKEIEKHELYVKYIYKLAELHEKSHSCTEAGFTLLLHAGELEWSSDVTVAAVGRYPEQTSLERKEQLYMDAIRLFSEGKSWECGVPLCKELAGLYENTLFDYPKLASILKKRAQFHERIIDILELRVSPEYFMVGYYGRGFPLFLRNKVFIHRGQPYERLSSFIKRLTDDFTTAQILKTVSPPDNDIQNSSGMHLQVRTVQPISEDQEMFRGKQVPDRILEYYKTNEVQRFSYDRPFHKGKKNKECEFASLWIERTTFTTSNKFPGVINWFDVSSTETVEMNPLDIALETVNSKNNEILSMVEQYKVNKALSINPLSMQLNGVIDAAVMGGVANYDKIFFNDEYVKEHPDHAEGVRRLRALIEEQTIVLEQGLSVHSQRIDSSLRGLHTRLEQCFEEFQCIVYPERKAARAKKVARSTTMARPLPPAPLGGSPPLSSTRTLPNRAIVRRATGMPGKMGRPPSSSIYEDTDFKTDIKPKVPAKRSVSNVSNFRSPAPNQPPPRLSQGGSSGGSPLATKRLSATPSSGGSSEHLDTIQEGLKRISIASVDSLEPDIGGKDYEPIEEYLVGSKPENDSPIAKLGQGLPVAMVPGQRSSVAAPSYPAPPPPNKSPNEEENDDGYEKVNIIPGTNIVESAFVDDVERAELPLRPSPRTSTVSHPPSKERERSPSAPEVSSNDRLSTSPQDFSKSLPKFADTKHGKVLIPPEPTSPPPSPPTGRDVISPPSPKLRPPSPLTQAVVRPVSPEVVAEQPRLPPKQRKTVSTSQDENIYEFDRLSPPPPVIPNKAHPPTPTKPQPYQPPVEEDNVYFDHLVCPPPVSTEPIEPTVEQDNVYFDHLVGPPPKQSSNQVPPTSHVTEPTNQISDDQVYFDHLVTGPPPISAKKSSPQQPPEDDDVYFNHLTGPPPSTSPNKQFEQLHGGQSSSGAPPIKEKKKWPPQPPSPTKEEAAPPVPIKKRATFRRTSENASEVSDPPIDPGRPVPRPRTNTLKRAEPIPETPIPPRPPKPSSSVPSLPPKPKGTSTKTTNGEPRPPPLPNKTPSWVKK